MADSLRDQLLKAGFSSPAPNLEKKSRAKRKPRKPSRASGAGSSGEAQQSRPPTTVVPHHSRNAAAVDVEAQKRKALKARIKALIERDLVDKPAGESVYRYILGTRIRELHVTPEVHRKLAEGVLSVTRLNGNTCIVPAATIEAIRQINPDWAIMKPASDTSTDVEGYEQFQVPDDLLW